MPLLLWQWRAYWRRILRGGTAARSNLIILGLISAAAFARYLTFLRDTASQTAKGDSSSLSWILPALLLAAFQPNWDSGTLPFGRRETARFPLTPFARWSLRLASRFIAPTSLLLAIGCLAGVWPLLRVSHSALAVLSFYTLLPAAFLASAALADLASTARFQWPARAVWILFAAAMFPGAKLIVLAGAGNWLPLPVSVLLLALAAFASWRSLPAMLRHAPPAAGATRPTSAARMTLARRELRLHVRFLEIRTGWLISAALAVYLATAAHPEPDALRVMLGVLAFLTVGVAMNTFGPDGEPGLDRFLLLPVSPARILALKNRTYAALVCLPALPLAALAGWRFGWREGAANLFEAVALTLAVLAWGNIASVRHPEREASGGYLLDQLIAMGAIALPTAIAIGTQRRSPSLAPLSILACGVFFAVLYWLSRRWSARYFAFHYEEMREALL